MFIISLFVSLLLAFNIYQWGCIIILSLLCYWFYLYKNNLWMKLGVPHSTPLPFFGNDIERVFGLKTMQQAQISNYEKFADFKFAGVYNFSDPVLFVKDAELVEQMLIKDFSYFTDRNTPINDENDPLIGHLFNLTGKKWKTLRNKLSPVFTSGKLKTMHQQLIDCADVLTKVLEKEANTEKNIDFKDLMAKFTTDVIGSCAYGLNMDSLDDPENQFRKMGRNLFKIGLKSKLRFIIRYFLNKIHPKLMYAFGISFIKKDVNNFFYDLIKSTVKLRDDNPQYCRNDFIQLLINLKSDNIKPPISEKDNSNDDIKIDEKVMAANSFLFFVAGFETTASTLSYALFELSQNPSVQDNLYNEIKLILPKYGGQPTYEALKDLKYMDLVLSETLRKYPPVPGIPRICTENYRIPNTNVIIPKKCRVLIPAYAIHRDPNIYPNPEDFDPQRFSLDNKENIPKGAYLPFGDGPRICIGARFAQMEMKVCLSKILLNFKISKSPLMGTKIEFDPNAMFLAIPKGGVYMKVEKRSQP